jgi:hypothetical protein
MVLIAEMHFGEVFWIYTYWHHREKISGPGYIDSMMRTVMMI